MTNAYNGSEPYIFISYSHKNKEAVLRAIDVFNSKGYRVWYDSGIEPASEWPEYIAERLMSSRAVLAFMSKDALESHNCRREINFAIELKKDLLVAYLEDVDLTPGMRMQLGTLQAVYRSRYSNNEDMFLEYLCDASIFDVCRGNEPIKHNENAANDNTAKANDNTLKNNIIIPEKKTDAKKPEASEKEKKCITQEDILECAADAFNRQMNRDNRLGRFKPVSSMSRKQISNAISSYAPVASESILYMMDDSFMGNGKSGYVITDTDFYSGGMLLSKFHFSLENLKSIKKHEQEYYLLLTFKDGTEKKLFFNNYCIGILLFFEEYLKLRDIDK